MISIIRHFPKSKIPFSNKWIKSLEFQTNFHFTEARHFRSTPQTFLKSTQCQPAGKNYLWLAIETYTHRVHSARQSFSFAGNARNASSHCNWSAQRAKREIQFLSALDNWMLRKFARLRPTRRSGRPSERDGASSAIEYTDLRQHNTIFPRTRELGKMRTFKASGTRMIYRPSQLPRRISRLNLDFPFGGISPLLWHSRAERLQIWCMDFGLRTRWLYWIINAPKRRNVGLVLVGDELD